MELSLLHVADALADCEPIFDADEPPPAPPAYLARSYDLCVHGHEWTHENTVYYSNGAFGKKRTCRTCQRESEARRVPKPDMKPAHLEGIYRADALPEYAHYEDTGCDLSPSCLECPLEKCKYDDPLWATQQKASRRIEQFISLRERGMSIQSCADAMGASRRQCFRWSAIAYKDKPKPKPVRVTRVLTTDAPAPAPSNTEAIRAAVADARRALAVLQALRA